MTSVTWINKGKKWEYRVSVRISNRQSFCFQIITTKFKKITDILCTVKTH